MSNPDHLHQNKEPVSVETFVALRYAINNLFRFGAFARKQQTVLENITFHHHKIRIDKPTDEQPPTHVDSGPMVRKIGHLPYVHYSVFTRIESLETAPFTILGDQIDPASIITFSSADQGEYLVNKTETLVISTDKRVFHSIYLPQREYLSSCVELSDSAVSDHIDMFTKDAPSVQAYMASISATNAINKTS